jgi:hypothetical protein
MFIVITLVLVVISAKPVLSGARACREVPRSNQDLVWW